MTAGSTGGFAGVSGKSYNFSVQHNVTDHNARSLKSGSNEISILENMGDGNFAEHVTYATGLGPSSICAADIDLDGDDDLAVANLYSNNKLRHSW